MKSLQGISLFLTVAATISATAAAAEFTLKGPMKPAWIYLNAKNDGGWQQAVRIADSQQ